MINFDVQVDGITVLDRSFNRLAQLDDFRPLWGNVIAEFHAIETEQFASEGVAGGSRWQPLKPATVAFKERNYPGKPILQATSELKESLTQLEAPGAIVRPLKDELILGTSIPQGIFHQRGTRRMPRRPPINLSESQKRRIQKSLQAGLVQFVRNALGGN